MSESNSHQGVVEPMDTMKELLESPSIAPVLVSSQEELKPIGTLLSPAMTEEVQEELSKTISTLRRVKRCLIIAQNRKNGVRQAQFEEIQEDLVNAIAELKQDPGKLLFVRRTRRDAQFVIRELTNPMFGSLINAFKYALYESSTPVKVLLGLLLGLPMYLLIPFIPYRPIIDTFFAPVIKDSESCAVKWRREAETFTNNERMMIKDQQTRAEVDYITKCDVDMTMVLLILAGSAGFLGSIVSILTRIKEFENERYADAVLPIYIGAFKPLIGSTFGILVFTLISSSILPLKFDEGRKEIQVWYALYTIAFVAGFSERLVKDIISQAENKVLPPGSVAVVYPIGQTTTTVQPPTSSANSVSTIGGSQNPSLAKPSEKQPDNNRT